MQRILFFIALAFFSVTCVQAQSWESGVPRELASFRKNILQDVSYSFALSLSRNADDSIELFERINFTLRTPDTGVALDFKEKADALQELSVNNKKIPIDFRNEHIYLPASSLKEGANIVRIQLRAGTSSLNRRTDFLYTLLVPERARTFFPCFDQPDLKATFQLAADLPAEWEIVSNSPVAYTTQNGNRKLVSFSPTAPISTYLFTMVAGKFKTETRTVNGKEMTCYYRETDTAKIRASMDTLFGLHRRALEFMQEYTGIPYPFAKLDFVAVPDFQYGGMEHVGAIDYRASTLFLDEKATPAEKLSRINVIAHEVAHMWFGDLVTMQWFDDVWMKEVFANFMADKVAINLLPSSKKLFDYRRLLEHYPAAYGIDRTAGANPIRQPLENLDEAGTLYGDIIYHKAPIVMGQLQETIGAETLQHGLRIYLNRYRGVNASWPDLINILDSLTRNNLQHWNEQWVNTPGRPVITASLQKIKGQPVSITLTQEGELNRPGTWQQLTSILLAWKGSVEVQTIQMNKNRITIPLAGRGRKLRYIIYNPSGEGYGYFPFDIASLPFFHELKQPVVRASAYINMYENVVNGTAVTPEQFMDITAHNLLWEKEPLIISRLVRYMRNIFWQFIPANRRDVVASSVEPLLWQAIATSRDASTKRALFQLITAIGITPTTVNRLAEIWAHQQNDLGIALTEDDYINASAELAIRLPQRATAILDSQYNRVQNADKKSRFAFVAPSLSPVQTTRDSVFNALLDEKNRDKEVWASAAMEYLNHPLRSSTSEKYILPALEKLEEVQKTGDIFFPGDWLRALLGNYQTTSAAAIVTSFLEQRPDYNPRLRAKLLQEADDLFRAARILH